MRKERRQEQGRGVTSHHINPLQLGKNKNGFGLRSPEKKTHHK